MVVITSVKNLLESNLLENIRILMFVGAVIQICTLLYMIERLSIGVYLHWSQCVFTSAQCQQEDSLRDSGLNVKICTISVTKTLVHMS